MRPLYGYRYKPGGMVIELRGLGFECAVTEVLQRRGQQRHNGNPATAELVERDGAGWRFVPLPEDEAVAS